MAVMAGERDAVRVGVWAVLGEPRMAALLERGGFDWVVLDQQHGHFDDRAVRHTLALRGDRAATVLVRPAANDPMLIGRALDAGADGVVVPLVGSAAEAEAAVAAAHYPPRGIRSRGQLPGLERPDLARPFVALMVETRAGLADVAGIARTADVDLLFVGPNDLAASLGTSVDDLLADESPDGPLGRVVEAGLSHGVPTGAFSPTVERARSFARHGFTWVIAALDADLVSDGRRIVDLLR